MLGASGLSAKAPLIATEDLHADILGEEVDEIERPSDKYEELFQSIRKEKVDYSYHRRYRKERVAWQNSLLRKILGVDKLLGTPQPERRRPWIIFTGGAMGAGKGHVVRCLKKRGILNLPLVPIDPDRIRRAMPEWREFVAQAPVHAGSLTHKEAGLIAEICTEAALRLNLDIWVDGSLRDAVWVKSTISDIRERYPDYLLGVIYVTAGRERILERVGQRGYETGRHVPSEKIDASILGSALTVNLVASKVDLLLTFDNNDEDPALVAVETHGIRREISDPLHLHFFFDDHENWIQPWARLAISSRLMDSEQLSLSVNLTPS